MRCEFCDETAEAYIKHKENGLPKLTVVCLMHLDNNQPGSSNEQA